MLKIKELVKKARQNHMLVMLICCLVPFAVVFGGVTYLGWNSNILFWSVLLLCPLSHLLLMRGHGQREEEH